MGLFNKSKSRRGMTIAEIVVVLAVVAIASTIVVSFSIMVNTKTRISNSKVDAVGEIRVVESIVDGWIYRQTLDSAEFNIVDGVLNSKVGEDVYTLKFENNQVLGTLPDSERLWFDTESIDGISFEIIRKEDTEENDLIIFCTVDYRILNGLGEEEIASYIFCVNEYVGDII